VRAGGRGAPRLLFVTAGPSRCAQAREVVVYAVVYDCRTCSKLCAGGGGRIVEDRMMCYGNYEPRPLWTSLTTTH
jgi:hypothetical protein